MSQLKTELFINMKHYSPLITLFLLILLVGCKKDPQEIYSEEKSGVVLICNEFYYDTVRCGKVEFNSNKQIDGMGSLYGDKLY